MRPRSIPPARSSRAASLANTFRRHALPVVLVNVTGEHQGVLIGPPARHISSPDWADLVDELDVQPDDHLVTKQRRAPSTTLGSTLIYAALASPRWCWPA